MATIVKQKGRRFWYAYYRDGDGQQHLVSTKIEHTPDGKDHKERGQAAADNRRLAREYANRLEDLERGDPVEAQFRKLVADISERKTARRLEFPTARTYLLNWLESRNLAPTTIARYKKPIHGFLESLGSRADLPLGNVTPADVDAYCQARLKEGITPSTVNVDKKTLNVPFTAAMRAGIVQLNPVAASEPIEAAMEERKPFTVKEVEGLLEVTAGTDWATAIHLSAFAGLRLGDAVNLQWQDINLFESTISFRPRKTARKKRDMVLPIAPRLKDYLLTLPQPKNGKGPLCPELAGKSSAGKSGLSMAFSRRMEKAKISSGSMEASGEKGRTFNKKSFHSLRHFFISELERKGVAPDIRMKLAGHTTSAAHGRYTHTEIETLRKAVADL
jgi:integrase